MRKLLIIAAIFWFNPLVSSVDILPDLIGYLLVMKAFSKQAYICDYADDCCVAAKKMCIVSGVKLLSVTMVTAFDPTMSLLFSFVFGIVECVFGIPFFIKLFNAYSHMIPAESGEICTLVETKLKRFTIVAFVLRLVLAFMPDLTALSLNTAFTYDVDYTYYRFKPLFIGFCVIIALVINIIWLVKYIRLIKRAITRQIIEESENKFASQVENKRSVFVAKDNMRATVLMIIGGLFIFDFSMGFTNVDIFQDFMVGLIPVFAMLYLSFKGLYKLGKAFLTLGCVTCIHIVFCVWESIANKRYFEKYNSVSMLKISEAEDMYLMLTVATILASVALVATSIAVFTVMKKNARDVILQHSDIFSHSDIEYYLKEFNKRTGKNLVLAVVFGVLSMAAQYGMVALRPYAEWMILIDFVFEVLFIIFFIGYCLYIYDEVYKRILTFS